MNSPTKRRVSHRGAKKKGDQFERDLAAYFQERTGLPTVRSKITTPFMPTPTVGMPDLMNTPLLAVEAKRAERLDYRAALTQSARNAPATEHPIVINRRNQEAIDDSVVFIRLSDFMDIYTKALSHLGHKIP